ncbi:hypothetical protein NQX30_05030 [Candidatus Persebacteraceae bacterium Df01]|jgi:hypothetical protein|uniref:Nucleoside recognition domain-containing protein n=1 Tax=Candidatus Doriopsillibacter californiensis TaxID=2970740 RepID=A0ABT7QMC4_9GAMM|nr:hypothetical protein [Candidatus Persebacteraceae bacterium Df01]
MRAPLTALRELFKESAYIYWVVLRISLPLLVAIRLLDEHFGIVAVVGDLLAPIMDLVGLPGQAGIVWATAMLLNIYSALLVLISLWTQLELNSAQVTTLMLIVLVAHALPIELRITQKAGVRFFAMLWVRISGALAMGWLIHTIYNAGGWLQAPAHLLLSPPPMQSGWGPWFLGQAKNWAFIYLIIVTLVAFVRLLKITNTERLLIFLLAPILRTMGVGKKAVTITMVGMTLGISYGGALLINESKKGDISRRDMLCALTLLSLCHAVIEDTLLVMLVGAHISGVFFGRIIFSFVLMLFFAQLIKRLPDTTLEKIMLSRNPKTSS